jgi:hypothetical protein
MVREAADRDDEEDEELERVADTDEGAERGAERADAEPEQHEAGREDLGDDENHAEHRPDYPREIISHMSRQRRPSPANSQPFSIFFITNQTFAGRSARRRMKYGYQCLP